MMQISIEKTDFFMLLNQREIKMKSTVNKIPGFAFPFDFVSLLSWLCWMQQLHCFQGHLLTFKTEWQKLSATDEWGLGVWINLGRDEICFSSLVEHEGRACSVLWCLSVIAMDTTRIDPLSRGPTNTNAHTAKWKRSCSSWTHPLKPRSLAIHPAK